MLHSEYLRGARLVGPTFVNRSVTCVFDPDQLLRLVVDADSSHRGIALQNRTNPLSPAASAVKCIGKGKAHSPSQRLPRAGRPVVLHTLSCLEFGVPAAPRPASWRTQGLIGRVIERVFVEARYRDSDTKHR